MPVRLFVGNLSYDATEADLRELFSAAGNVTHLHMALDRETGRPRGFAFVEFAESAQAEEAIRRFNNQLFKGRPLAVNEARAREEGGPRPRPSGPPSRPYTPRPSWSTDPPDEGEQKPGRMGAGRSFGPDALPARKRKLKLKEGKERTPKAPVGQRRGGRYLDDMGLDDDLSSDFEGDNFAMRPEDAEDE
jgi:cold-inducible RNA-binding protein